MLPQIYVHNSQPLHEHLGHLVLELEKCESSVDTVYLIQVFGAVAKKEPQVSATKGTVYMCMLVSGYLPSHFCHPPKYRQMTDANFHSKNCIIFI